MNRYAAANRFSELIIGWASIVLVLSGLVVFMASYAQADASGVCSTLDLANGIQKISGNSGRPLSIKTNSCVIHGNASYGPESGQTLDSFQPNGVSQPIPGVIFVHGGAWTQGDKISIDDEAAAVANIGWAGISINYRLNGFPTEPQDVQTAIQWVKANALRYGVDPNRIAVVGASAGGNLAAYAATVMGKSSGLAALVTWSGIMDFRQAAQLNPDDAKIVENYIGCMPANCPQTYGQASPITHVAAGTPPTLVVNSTNEVVPLSQAQAMVSALQAIGTNVSLYALPGELHAMAYAPTAFPVTVNYLAQYLSPYIGAIPAVPAGTE